MADSSDDEANFSPLHELFDTALAFHESESKKVISQLEELLRSPSKKLELKSFIVRRHAGRTEFFIECHSSEDLALWTICLSTVLDNLLPVSECFQFMSTELTARIRVDSKVVKRALIDLNGILHRTNFGELEYMRSSRPPNISPDIASELLQWLIDTILEERESEKDALQEFTEELKTTPDEQWPLCSLTTNETDDGAKSCFAISCKSPLVLSLWASCIKILLSKIERTETANSYKFTFSPWTYVSMETVDFESHFDFLKPLAQKTSFDLVDFRGSEKQTLAKCSEFLKEGSVRLVSMDIPKTNNSYFTNMINFVLKVKPTRVSYSRIHDTLESNNLLPQLADVSDIITVVEYPEEDEDTTPLPHSILQKMLTKKCKYLEFSGGLTKMLLEEAETFIQFIHNLDKKVAIRIPTEAEEETELKIGEYTLQIFQEEDDQFKMDIEHLGIEPTLPEVLHPEMF